MKQIKTLLVTAFTGLALLSACNKEDDNIADLNNVANDDNISVSYRMNLDLPATPSLIAWSNGYIQADEIKFGAKRLNGHGNHGGDHVEYKTKIDQQIDLFHPSPLGTVHIPRGTYENINFKIRLAPQAPYHAMLIGGSYVHDGIVTPVQIILDEEMELKDEIKGPVMVEDGTDYLSLLSMSLAALTEGIDASMLDHATLQEDGTIVISRNANRGLYDRVVSNLSHMMKVRFK